MDFVSEYENGLSVRQIAERHPFSASKIRKILLSENVKMRSAREGLSLRKENSFVINGFMKKVIEGELLGDGCLVKRTNQSKFSFRNSKEDYTNWLANLFVENGITLSGAGVSKYTYFHKKWNKYYTNYSFSTLCSTQFRDMENIWYNNRIKHVPKDLEISPELVLHWYLGDGSLPRKEYSIFCTDSFTLEEVSILSDKLNQTIGIKSSTFSTPCLPTSSYENYHRIFVPKTSVPKLLEYVGKPPFESLSYKWDLNPIGKINHKIDIKKDVLYDLYITQKLTSKEIAEQFNCSMATINKKIRIFKIRKNK